MFTNLIYAMGGGGEGGSEGILGMILPFVIVIAIFFFLIILPQKKKDKQKKAMVDAMRKGDKVVTIGGLRGTVVGLDDRDGIVTIRVSGDVKLEYLKSAIANVFPRGAAE